MNEQEKLALFERTFWLDFERISTLEQLKRKPRSVNLKTQLDRLAVRHNRHIDKLYRKGLYEEYLEWAKQKGVAGNECGS